MRTFLLGGARSGKSRRALALAESVSKRRIYIATAEALDDEMADRIARHKSERGAGWDTLEAPLALSQAITDSCRPEQVCVVDCLTLWLSNLMHHERDPEAEVRARARARVCVCVCFWPGRESRRRGACLSSARSLARTG